MSLHTPKRPSQFPFTDITSGPTPIADFVEKVVVGIMLVFIVPIMAFVFVFGPAALLVYGVGGVTGLTAAWGELVLQVSAAPGSALPFGTILLQNVVFGALVSLLLATPLLRRSLDRYNLRHIAHALGTSTAVAALQLSAAALVLHVSLGLLIALGSTGLGVILPLPFAAETVVSPQSLTFFILSGGAGGGWPPTMDSLSLFAIITLSLLVLAGAVFGGTLWVAFGFVVQRLAPSSANEAVSSGGAMLGAALANAITRGQTRRLFFDWRGDVFWAGLMQGAVSGAVFGALVLIGATVLGVS